MNPRSQAFADIVGGCIDFSQYEKGTKDYEVYKQVITEHNAMVIRNKQDQLRGGL